MTRVVLTGRAVDAGGRSVVRAVLVSILRSYDWHVEDTVHYGTDYLVASRTDTQKAQAARTMGVTTITYAEMWRLLEPPTVGAIQSLATNMQQTSRVMHNAGISASQLTDGMRRLAQYGRNRASVITREMIEDEAIAAANRHKRIPGQRMVILEDE